MDLLFTYGTLRKGYPHKMADLLARSAHWLGPAVVSGYLFDLGFYPGLVVDAHATSVVTGDLFQLHNPQTLLPVLDDYEGVQRNDGLPPEYERRQIEVRTTDGSATCWTYIYVLAVHSLKHIEHGDYLRYRM